MSYLIVKNRKGFLQLIIEIKIQTTNVLIAIIGCQTRRCIITAAAGKAMAIFFPKLV